MGMERKDVYRSIDQERAYQERKFGRDKQQSLPGFLTIIESELIEAKRAWLKGGIGRNSAMHEVLQIAATCVAAMEKYGVMGCPMSTDDAALQMVGDGSALADTRGTRPIGDWTVPVVDAGDEP